MNPMKHRDRHPAGTPHRRPFGRPESLGQPQPFGAHFHHPPEDFAEGEDRPGRRGGPHGGPGPRGGHRGPGGRGPGGRGRVPRGDVRTAVLLLLDEEPMHGYQLMQAIGDRSGGRWTPSPGAIYPALNLLEDEGLVTVTAESGRKVATLTESGRALVAEQPRHLGRPVPRLRRRPRRPGPPVAARAAARRHAPGRPRRHDRAGGRSRRDPRQREAGDVPPARRRPRLPRSSQHACSSRRPHGRVSTTHVMTPASRA